MKDPMFRAGTAPDPSTIERDEAAEEIDQIRALRRYAQQWAPEDTCLAVGGEQDTLPVARKVLSRLAAKGRADG